MENLVSMLKADLRHALSSKIPIYMPVTSEKKGLSQRKKKQQQQHDPTYFLQHPGAAEEDTNKLIRGEFCNNPSHDFFLQISSSITDSHAITNKILTVSQL